MGQGSPVADRGERIHQLPARLPIASPATSCRGDVSFPLRRELGVPRHEAAGALFVLFVVAGEHRSPRHEAVGEHVVNPYLSAIRVRPFFDRLTHHFVFAPAANGQTIPIVYAGRTKMLRFHYERDAFGRDCQHRRTLRCSHWFKRLQNLTAPGIGDETDGDVDRVGAQVRQDNPPFSGICVSIRDPPAIGIGGKRIVNRDHRLMPPVYTVACIQLFTAADDVENLRAQP